MYLVAFASRSSAVHSEIVLVLDPFAGASRRREATFDESGALLKELFDQVQRHQRLGKDEQLFAAHLANAHEFQKHLDFA